MANLKDTIVLGNLTVTGKITGAIDSSGGSGVSVVNNNPTLDWGMQSTVATIGGASITVTMPSTPSDTKVTQNYSFASTQYPVLFSATAGISATSSRGNTTALLNNSIYVTPADGALTGNVLAASNYLHTAGYISVQDQTVLYPGDDNFGDSDIDAFYYARGITVSSNQEHVHHLSFPANSGTFALTSDITNHYWADIKVSDTANTATTPTFGSIKTNLWYPVGGSAALFIGDNTDTATNQTRPCSITATALDWIDLTCKGSYGQIALIAAQGVNIGPGIAIGCASVGSASVEAISDGVAPGIAIGAAAEANNYNIAIGGGAYARSVADSADLADMAIGVYASTSENNKWRRNAIGCHAHVGNFNFTTVLGLGDASAAHQCLIGDTMQIYCYHNSIASTSDERDKADIQPITDSALPFLMDLQPITYVLNPRTRYKNKLSDVKNYNIIEPTPEEQEQHERYVRNREMVNRFGFDSQEYDREAHQQGTLKGHRQQIGFSAQQVLESLQKHYNGSASFALVNSNLYDTTENHDIFSTTVDDKEQDGLLSLAYSNFIPLIIKAMQEQQLLIEQQDLKLQKLCRLLGVSYDTLSDL